MTRGDMGEKKKSPRNGFGQNTQWHHLTHACNLLHLVGKVLLSIAVLILMVRSLFSSCCNVLT